jgi:hypothetical protein
VTLALMRRHARTAALAADWPSVVRRFETLLLDAAEPSAVGRAVLATT